MVVGVEAALEIGGGTAFVTPVPNLPEFKIYNAQGAWSERDNRSGIHVINERST
jgi:hypothetical protein